ncbi:MAG TPA: alkaline phosphatase family protein [Solirubrobacteraceae bacterium]
MDGQARTETRLTRRAMLTAAAGGAATLALSRGVPAWARPVASAAAGIRQPDSLPFPALPAGTPATTLEQIQHIVVVMMENHSFDNLLGMVRHEVPGRAGLDGLRVGPHGFPTEFNPNSTGKRVYARVGSSPCQQSSKPSQAWNASHTAWDSGKNDGFVLASGPVAMELWDQQYLPYTYSLAEYFPIGQRYFCSVLGPTYPNRRFLFCGTSSGLVATDNLTFSTPAVNGTIFDRLDAYGISWRDYFSDTPSTLIVPGFATLARASRIKHIGQFYGDAKAGKLPQFSLVEPGYEVSSEENPQDIQFGERFVAKVVNAVIKSPNWRHTALFLTYDEHGGYYDHVPPPPAIAPDSTAPIQEPGTATLAPGGFDVYGFRVPLIVVSPWAKAGYASNVVQDHTSITAFVERKWNLPAMTFRDANAAPMTDYFDFAKPRFLQAPALASAPGLVTGLAECIKAGFDPPRP